MKHRNLIYFLILTCMTAAGLWLLPKLVRKATYTPADYPFVYYSSLLDRFGLIDYADKEMPLSDTDGNRYTQQQLDSLLPLFSYRQLASDGRLPDSVRGVAVNQQILRLNSLAFKYNPKSQASPGPGLYILLESMPKRVGLELPPDVFRLRDGIEFIDAATNRVDREKSERFRQAFDKAGFLFPAQWAVGNPTTRKAYDEGYFSLDAKGDLFHIKMVNGRPYVRDTRVGRDIDIASFSMYEVSNKRFYGFLFDRQGHIYIIESDEGGYKPVRLEMDPVDLANDQVTLMGNLLYWTVTVNTSSGRRYYALENATLQQVDTHFIGRTPGKWDAASRWLFPVYLTFEHGNSGYIFPCIHFTGFTGFGVNLLAAAAYLLLAGGCRRKKAALSLYVFLTGIAGLLATALLSAFKKNQ